MPVRWVRRNMSTFTFTFLANLFLGLAIPMVSLSAHGGGFGYYSADRYFGAVD